MTTGIFKHIDLSSTVGKPWGKVDGPGSSFTLSSHPRPVSNIRNHPSTLNTDNSGFALVHSPATEKSFTDDAAIRGNYYSEVSSLLREHLPSGKVSKVVIFDHTIRRRDPSSPRQPVQQVHVDQTPGAAEVRVRRHLPAEEAEALLKKRYQIVNVWRPISHPATDFPLAVIDWRSTQPEDFIPVDLMYPVRTDSAHASDNEDDDRGKEKLAAEDGRESLEGYEVKGETLGVKANEEHRFYYAKDMTPDEVLLLKCFDSHGQGLPDGKEGLAVGTPHTAFVDPATPEGTKGRESIEVRCLVFYE